MTLSDFWDTYDTTIVGVGASLFLVVLIAFCIAGSIQEGKEWAAFSTAHNCKVVGRMTGNTYTTVAPIIGGNGGVAVGVASTPAKTGYSCDDGVTYWR